MALALSVRAMLPAGWMVSNSGGYATIELCSSDGLVEAWIDDRGTLHKESPGDSPQSDPPCVFAPQAGEPGVNLPRPIIVTSLWEHASPIAPAVAPSVGQGLAAPPPPAIGPPALV